MKKKLFALALAAVTLLSLFALGACRNPDHKDDGGGNDIIIPDPEPVDGLTLIAGNWKIESVQTTPSDSSGIEQPPVSWDWYSLRIEEDGTLTLNHFDGQTDHAYQGKAENADTLNYYRFSCTVGDVTVKSNAYLYPDGKTLSFTAISCEGGSFGQNYMSCTCVRATL